MLRKTCPDHCDRLHVGYRFDEELAKSESCLVSTTRKLGTRAKHPLIELLVVFPYVRAGCDRRPRRIWPLTSSKGFVVIYRQMPAIWDRSFREAFYTRWGRESAVISARTRVAAYPEYRQLLSIKAADGGSEDYFIDGRRVAVDDDTFLILNHGRSYGSRIEAIRPVHSFSIFFDAQLTAQVREALLKPARCLLAEAVDEAQPTVEFSERLFSHDTVVSPPLRYIRTIVDGGLQDEMWLDEQLLFLLMRMMKSHYNRLRSSASISSVKPATRRELLERIHLGIDFIYTRYRDPIGLRDIAGAARLSQFHFLRTFQSVHGMTPSAFLIRIRAAKALRLLQTTSLPIANIAENVGFGSRTSLFRHMCALYASTPTNLRRGSVPSDPAEEN